MNYVWFFANVWAFGLHCYLLRHGVVELNPCTAFFMNLNVLVVLYFGRKCVLQLRGEEPPDAAL